MNTRKSRIGIALALIAAMLAATAIYVHAKQAQGNPAFVAEKENAADTIAPAVEAFPMQVATNGRPDYMNNVEYTDSTHSRVKIAVDSSAVDLSKAGEYPVVFYAENEAGNVAQAKTSIEVIDPKEKIIYLTFDDGPSPNTPHILKILRDNGVKATFFVTAQWPKSLPYMTQAARDGNVVAAHSYSHNFKIYSSLDAYFADLERIEQEIEKYTGQRTRIVRFPGGSSNHVYRRYHPGNRQWIDTLKAALLKRGYQYVDWSLDSKDADGNHVPVTTLVSSACHTYHPQMCLLMHDAAAKKTTVEALPAIIKYFKAQGYKFGTIKSTDYVCHHGEHGMWPN